MALRNAHPKHGFLTLHRPSNVDNPDVFHELVEALNQISETLPIFFPVHPRTRKMIERFDVKLSDRIHCLEPLSFGNALFLWKDAQVVLTDSGGLQEETTALGVPCITLRENTERPITIELGTNTLAGTQKASILKAFNDAMHNTKPGKKIPPLWDGKAAERIWSIILSSPVDNSI
jgi:UDP-N-acetylglucosamine 2-epimerase (non-hydrolysing)